VGNELFVADGRTDGPTHMMKLIVVIFSTNLTTIFLVLKRTE